MSRGSSYTPRRGNSRRARQGIKLVHDVASLVALPVSGPWLAALGASIPAAARAQGEDFAREQLVMSLDIRPGVIEGVVQLVPPAPQPPTGTMQQPTGFRTSKPAMNCSVVVHIPIHDETTWQRAVQSLAADSSAATPILAGELPAELDQLLARHSAPLVPRPGEPIEFSCSCDAGGTCPHIAALIVLAADRMQADPSQSLLLRGTTPAELVERVRQVRTAVARQSAPPGMAAGSDLARHERASELAGFPLEEFWRTGPELDDLVHLPPPTHAPHALLRRLGPSPLGGSFPLVGLLASAYDTIKAHAEKLRDLAEEEKD